jgi:hypothetical protein
MQCYVARIRVENCNDLGFGIPVSNIVDNELEMEKGRRKIPFVSRELFLVE